MLRKFLNNPYVRLMRMDKPIGSILLGIPCLWGVALCYTHTTFKESLLWDLLFSLGAILLRSAGCVVNDIFDCNFDRYVERTKTRPLASRELSKTHAVFVLIALLLCGLGVFMLLNPTAKILSLIAFAIAVIYPLTKRFFSFPQLILGLAFNSGVLIAIAQLKPDMLFTPAPWILYLAGIFWTLYYDTLYAVQDMNDDVKLGLHSTALFFQNHLKLALSLFCAGMIACVFAAGFFIPLSLSYFFWTIVIAFEVYYMLKKMNLHDKRRGGVYFSESTMIGISVFFNLLFFT